MQVVVTARERHKQGAGCFATGRAPASCCACPPAPCLQTTVAPAPRLAASAAHFSARLGSACGAVPPRWRWPPCRVTSVESAVTACARSALYAVRPKGARRAARVRSHVCSRRYRPARPSADRLGDAPRRDQRGEGVGGWGGEGGLALFPLAPRPGGVGWGHWGGAACVAQAPRPRECIVTRCARLGQSARRWAPRAAGGTRGCGGLTTPTRLRGQAAGGGTA